MAGPFMALQSCIVSKAHVTIRADIWLFPGVDPHMLFQILGAYEPPAAHTALMRLFSRVTEYMHTQVPFAGEWPFALIADMRLSHTMGHHVIFQAFFNSKTCAATHAFIRLFAGVIAHVPGE